MMPRLLLNFICKNEAQNIGRMLASAEPWIVGCVCTDTGSTDATPLMIEAFFRAHNKPCVITHEPFIDYAQARNAALRAARASGIEHDYLLLLDCDHELVMQEGGLIELSAMAYNLVQASKEMRFTNVRLLRSDATVEYVGRTHEALIMPEGEPLWNLSDDVMWVRDHETGSNRPEKYTRDMELLERDYADDPNNPRTVFYIAQTLRGGGRFQESREWSDKRIAMEPRNEETWWTLLSKAQCGEMLELDCATVSYDYLTAFLFMPARVESMYFLGAYHRRRGEHELAILYSRAAALTPHLSSTYLTDPNVSEWLALDDWLGMAIILGMGADARHAAKLLSKRKLPDSERERIEHNIKLVEQLS